MGPISYGELKKLIWRGVIRPEYRVWKRGDRFHVTAKSFLDSIDKHERDNQKAIKVDCIRIQSYYTNDGVVKLTEIKREANAKLINILSFIIVITCVTSWSYIFNSHHASSRLVGTLAGGFLWTLVSYFFSLPLGVAYMLLAERFLNIKTDRYYVDFYSLSALTLLIAFGFNTTRNAFRPIDDLVNICLDSSSYEVRTGATCNDGSSSSATGRGACSHHGGVMDWRVRDVYGTSRSECLIRHQQIKRKYSRVPIGPE